MASQRKKYYLKYRDRENFKEHVYLQLLHTKFRSAHSETSAAGRSIKAQLLPHSNSKKGTHSEL